MPSVELSIVLPCCHGSRGLKAILDRYADVGAGERFEVLLVDAGTSHDASHTIERLAREYKFARCVGGDMNLGYGQAVFAGFQEAEGELLAWSRPEVATDPGDVFRALSIYRRSPDRERLLVKGQRLGRCWREQFMSWSMQTVSTALFWTRMHEINAQPKLFHRDLMLYLTRPPHDTNFDVYVLYKAMQHGWRVESFPVKSARRQQTEQYGPAAWRAKFRTMRRSTFYMWRLSRAEE
jgi:hypothetical protein